MLFEGGCTHHTVLAWMEQVLLQELKPNSLVIMDNAPFHNKPKIKQLFEKNGHKLLPLPPYSPDLPPIEQSFATIKKTKAILKPFDREYYNTTSLFGMTITDDYVTFANPLRR